MSNSLTHYDVYGSASWKLEGELISQIKVDSFSDKFKPQKVTEADSDFSLREPINKYE